jgi:tetratricopeptide (TPR) repeat protein
MSDDIDDVPPPPPSGELAQFLWRHARTGEPTTADVARLRPLVTGEPDDTELQRVRQNVVRGAARADEQPAPARRSFLPPELLAVAAVLLLALLVQLTWLAFKKPEVEPVKDSGLDAVVAAYRAGDLEGATRLAGSSCTDANCASMSAKLLRAMALSAKLDSLDATQLEELARLDEALSGGVATELTEAIARRRASVTAAPQVVADTREVVNEKVDVEAIYAEARALERENKKDQALAVLGKCLAVAPEHAACLALRNRLTPLAQELIDEANALRKTKHFDEAALRAERCVKLYPLEATCYRLLGSIYANIAARDQSASDMERAKANYQRFLEVADPADSYVPKVKAVLDAASEPASPEAVSTQTQAEVMQELFDVGLYAKSKNSPAEAARSFQKVVESPDAPPALVARAKEELRLLSFEARELYLRGYQLKESDPEAAAKFFRQAMALTSRDDETHQKAKSRLADLGVAVDEPSDAAGRTARQNDDLAPATTLTLRVGQRVTLTVPGLQRIAVGDPSVMDVRTLGNSQVQVIGVERGKATLLMWRGDGSRDARLVIVK